MSGWLTQLPPATPRENSLKLLQSPRLALVMISSMTSFFSFFSSWNSREVIMPCRLWLTDPNVMCSPKFTLSYPSLSGCFCLNRKISWLERTSSCCRLFLARNCSCSSSSAAVLRRLGSSMEVSTSNSLDLLRRRGCWWLWWLRLFSLLQWMSSLALSRVGVESQLPPAPYRPRPSRASRSFITFCFTYIQKITDKSTPL